MPHPLSFLAARRAALLALAVLVPAQAASADTAAVPLVERGQPGIKLQGGIDAFQGGITVPSRWSSWTGQLRLQWGASSELAAGSAIRVSVGGRVLGTREIDGRAGSATFTIPRTQATRGTTSIPVSIESRLRTKRTVCPGPDDLAAYLQFSAASSVQLDGSWSSTPARLRDLPGSLVTGVGREPSRLLIRFSKAPDSAQLRAAGVAVGEVAALAGGPGVALRVSQPSAQLEPRAGESVITIVPASGPATIRVSESVGQPPRVWLTGSPDQLVRAAGALRPNVARELGGATASKLSDVVVRHRKLPRRIQLTGGRWEGFGEGEVTVQFALPVERQALRGARLRMAADYDAPGGGRATVSVNGRLLTAEELRSTGASRFTVEEQLAGRGPALQRADLRAGANRVTVNADLGYPRGRCEQPDQAGSVSVGDFGSVTLLTRARPVETTLSTFPFPFNKVAGWKGTTVQLPQAATGEEIAAVLNAVGTARRVTEEPALPEYQLGGKVPAGHALVFARPNAVPAELVKDVPGGASNGVLAASGSADAVKIVAVGRRALSAFDGGYEIGAVTGRVAQVTADGTVISRVPDPQRVTGVERGATSWRWPLIVIIVAGVGLLLLGLRGAIRRTRGSRT